MLKNRHPGAEAVWVQVRTRFARQRVRKDVVKKLIECGMSVSRDARLYVGEVEVSYTAVSRALGVDRRVVRRTAEQIAEDRILFDIFSKTRPMGTSLAEVAGKIGYTAVVIEADPTAPGIMAAVAAILADEKVVIRQAVADDPEMVADAKMTLVLEGKLPGEALGRIGDIESVRSIRVLK
jgi:uncharacterized protein